MSWGKQEVVSRTFPFVLVWGEVDGYLRSIDERVSNILHVLECHVQERDSYPSFQIRLVPIKRNTEPTITFKYTI